MNRTEPGASAPRQVAARLVFGVSEQQASLNALLPRHLATLDEPRQRALAQELAFGTLRWYPRLETLLAALLSRPLKKKDRDVHALLLVGLYQLLMLEMPDHAAISETVEAVRALGKHWAAGLVNAVLRNAQRQGPALLAKADASPVARWAHPEWWIERLRGDWPQHWEAILQANNTRPPLVLRVNAGRGDRDSYLAELQAAGIGARACALGEQAIEVLEPVGVERLPGFGEGKVSVQDAAAQLCAPLLDLAPGQHVLDACAAPGGKTGHILESQSGLAGVVAVDSEPDRLDRVAENLTRLRLDARLVAADAADTGQWWDGRAFERILLDAPCSASGVVRRHPDIKLLRRAADLPVLAAGQRRLLEALWPLLAPGGMLLYATCSVFRTENSDIVQAFLHTHPDASEVPLGVDWGHALPVGRQLLPGEGGADGFYFARLSKT